MVKRYKESYQLHLRHLRERYQVTWIKWDPAQPSVPDERMWVGDRDPFLYYGNCMFCYRAGPYGVESCAEHDQQPNRYITSKRDGFIYNPLFLSKLFKKDRVTTLPIRRMEDRDDPSKKELHEHPPAISPEVWEMLEGNRPCSDGEENW